MNWVVAKIRWIMLVSGALTCAMFYAAVKPNEAMEFLFETTLGSPLEQIIVQSWAALVGVVGTLMIHGAFAPQARTQAMTVAGSTKLVFLGLMLASGREYLGERVSIVIALDAATVALFGLFMIGMLRTRVRRGRASQPVTEPASRPEQSARPPAPATGGSGPLPGRPNVVVGAARRPSQPTR